MKPSHAPSRPTIAVLLCAIALLSPAAVMLPHLAEAGKEDLYAVTGARVVTVSGPPLDNATVVMRDGVIEAVGKGVAPPVGARVLSGKGLTLTPGLIDGFGGVGLPAPTPAAASSAAERSSLCFMFASNE